MISQDSISLRCLNIDSRNRAAGTSEDFNFELLEAVEKPRGCVCWVTDASVPTTWPNISTNENILYLTETRGSQTKSFKLELSPGEMHLSAFRQALNDALDARQGSILESEVAYNVFFRCNHHEYSADLQGR